ncbi:MAG: Uma2 family endonuclease [Bacteroidetes bacterium SW_9_63_38]|nr:MAG: Uma2 family endonuclease [Bacteroidetes bacterium SW_9_63_38]
MSPLTKAPAPRERRFTVDEYYRMGEAGVFDEDDRVELLDGHIYVMSPIGSEHAACVRRLNRLFQSRLGGRGLVSVQNPVRLADDSEPEPDVVLLRPHDDGYASEHPGPEEVTMVVEVADTSLSFDRDVKLPLYAEAGIPEVWLVDLEASVIHVYRDPNGDDYHTHTTHDPDAELEVAGLSDGPLLPAAKILRASD